MRDKLGRRMPVNACVARPVGKREREITPKARDAMREEWDSLEPGDNFKADPNWENFKYCFKGRGPEFLSAKPRPLQGHYDPIRSDISDFVADFEILGYS